MQEVRLREVPERIVLVERGRLVVGELPDFLDAAFAAHRAVLDEAGVAAAGSSYVAFVGPVTDEVPGTVEVCTPVPHELARRTDLPLRVEPVHREAYTTLVKREALYPDILQAYALVETWAADAGLTRIGAPRETAFGDFDHAGEDDPVVDVAQPVE